MTDELLVYAEAIKEVAKAGGKVVDASRYLGRFIAPFISGSIEQGMGIVKDKLYYMRLERQASYIEKVYKKMNAIGLNTPNQTVPMKIVIPLLQAASIEDDDDLQERWANLMVNASNKDSGIDIRRTYIEILQNLTTIDIQALDKIYSVQLSGKDTIGVWKFPEEILVQPYQATNDIVPEKPKTEIELTIENLCRLRLINSAMWSFADHIHSVYQTVLGRNFYEACSNQKTVING